MNLLRRVISKLSRMGVLFFIPDKSYLKLRYWTEIGKKLNLETPQTFNEKLQWLKLYDRNPSYTIMVDKFLVKEYVEKKIGSQYVIPLLGVWDDAEKIDFSALPNEFVLKWNHDSGGLIICKDKSTLDIAQAKKKLKKCKNRNFYAITREWPYKNVSPKIICEPYISSNGEPPEDYKVLCFNGEPRFIEFHQGRYSDHTQDFYDVNWNKTDISQGGNTSNKVCQRPESLNEMLELSRVLAKNIKHVRIDWYIVSGKLYFGEITFYDGSGFDSFDKEEYDLLLGSFLDLKTK